MRANQPRTSVSARPRNDVGNGRLPLSSGVSAPGEGVGSVSAIPVSAFLVGWTSPHPADDVELVDHLLAARLERSRVARLQRDAGAVARNHRVEGFGDELHAPAPP